MGRLFPYPVANFQAQSGKQTSDQTVTGPSGWKWATVTLHNHRINFGLDNQVRSFEVGCMANGTDGTSVTVRIWAEVHLQNEQDHWDGSVTAVVDWYG